MALLETGKLAFVSGEIAPSVLARADVDRYVNAAIQLENWEVLVQGGVRRRDGTRYVASVKDPTKLTLLMAFEPTTTDAYVLEVGHLYLRIFTNGARVENPPGTPIELVTPYQESQLRELRSAQANDIMLFVHPSHAPRRLARLSNTSWELRLFPFDPAPLMDQEDTANLALRLSAVSGAVTIVCDTGSPFFPSDVQRVLVSGAGRALLTTYTAGNTMSALVLDAFSSTTVAAGSWHLEGSPWVTVTPSDTGTVGGTILLTYGQTQPAETELMGTAFASWTDYSGQVQLLTGVHEGTDNSADLLYDATHDFVVAGVLPTQIVHNTTNGSAGVISSVSPHACGISGSMYGGTAENDFDNGDAYTITETGTSRVSAGVLELHGGTAGHGWRQVAIPTTAGIAYEVRFTVVQAPLSVMVGSSAQASNLYAEATFDPGEAAIQFTATGATSYVQARNNQNAWAGLGACSVKRYTIDMRLSANLQKYIEIHGGLVQLLAVTGTGHTARVVRELTTDAPAAPGGWRLLAPAWSDTLGWPSAVVLYEGRLLFGGSARFPQTIWGSAIDDLINFGLGPLATDGLELSLVDSGGNITLNRLRWLMPAENLLTGTTHGEYRLIGSGDDPLSPLSPPRNRIQSTFGSDTVQPLKVGAALLFAQRQGSKLREMSFDERTQTTFVARDLTVTSNHLLQSARILQLAYQPEPKSVVWAVRSDGQLLGLTYDQSEAVMAWWRWVTDGAVESVCVIPHPTANAHQVWLIVRRTIGGVTKRCVEVIDPEAVMALRTPVQMENGLTHEAETVTGWAGLTLDCAKVYTGINTDTLTGLGHLEGQSVGVVADGAVLPNQTVSNGELKLPVTAQTAWVGLPYVARGKTVPIHTPARGTSAQLSKKRFVRLRARVEQTMTLVLHGERVPFRQPAMPTDQGVALFSGDKDITALGYSGQGVISFMADQPLPSTLLGIYSIVDQEMERG